MSLVHASFCSAVVVSFLTLTLWHTRPAAEQELDAQTKASPSESRLDRARMVHPAVEAVEVEPASAEHGCPGRRSRARIRSFPAPP